MFGERFGFRSNTTSFFRSRRKVPDLINPVLLLEPVPSRHRVTRQGVDAGHEPQLVAVPPVGRDVVLLVVDSLDAGLSRPHLVAAYFRDGVDLRGPVLAPVGLVG